MILSSDDRRYGLCVAATRGSGKSRFLGRYLGFSDFLAGIPTIVFDNGDTINNILDRISRLSLDMQKVLWPRVRYIDLAGLSGRVMPFPLYYRLGNESDLSVAARFVRTILKIDPELSSASIQGKTAIIKSGYTSGVALAQRNWQISEIEKLQTKLEPAYEARLLPFLLDDTQKAIFCADKPAIDWREVVEKKQLVLVNYQFVEEPEFILTWILSYFLAFLQQRGTNGSPISLIIDELGAFQAAQAQNSLEFFKDLRLLINTIMRRFNLWLTVGLQDIGDFSEEVQNLLLTLDTQLIGKTNSMPSARKLAAHFYRVDPNKVKRTISSWRQKVYPDVYGGWHTSSYHGTQDVYEHEEPVNYTVQEQIQEAAYLFTDELPRFTFLAKFRDGSVKKLSYADFEQGIYVREPVVGKIREWLMQRDGRKVEDILAEITARTAQPAAAPALSQVEPAVGQDMTDDEAEPIIPPPLPVRTTGKR